MIWSVNLHPILSLHPVTARIYVYIHSRKVHGPDLLSALLIRAAVPVAQLAPPISGIISIRYRQVMCTPPGGIRVMITAFNGPERYLRLTFQVRMHSQPLFC